MDQIANPKETTQEAMKANKPCYTCSGLMEAKRTTLHFERGGFYADVENVLAYICPHCGTRSISGPTAQRISQLVDDLFRSASESVIAEKPVPFTGVSMHRMAD